MSTSSSLRGASVNNVQHTTDLSAQSISASSTAMIFPAQDTSYLLSGFDPLEGGKASPFNTLEDCKNLVSTAGIACLEEVPSTGVSTSYTETVSNSEEKERFMQIIVGAEGGSVGISVSASADYLKSSATSEESVSHFIGAKVQGHVNRIRHPQDLKLTADAKLLLSEQPQQFLNNYGHHFVAAISHGGSFLGSYVMNAKGSSSSEELKTEAAFSYRSGFYSASGRAQYEKREDDLASSLQIDSNFKAVPRSGREGIAIESPEQLSETFAAWNEAVKGKPAPQTVSIDRYYASQDVQGVVNNMSNYTQNIFTSAVQISGITIGAAGTERMNTDVLLTTMTQYLQWEEVTDDATRKAQFESLNDKIRSHALRLETELGMTGLAFIQAELIAAGEGGQVEGESWLKYDGLKAEFDALLVGLPIYEYCAEWKTNQMPWGQLRRWGTDDGQAGGFPSPINTGFEYSSRIPGWDGMSNKQRAESCYQACKDIPTCDTFGYEGTHDSPAGENIPACQGLDGIFGGPLPGCSGRGQKAVNKCHLVGVSHLEDFDDKALLSVSAIGHDSRIQYTASSGSKSAGTFGTPCEPEVGYGTKPVPNEGIGWCSPVEGHPDILEDTNLWSIYLENCGRRRNSNTCTDRAYCAWSWSVPNRGDGYCLKDRTTVSPICSPYDNSQQRCNNAFTLVDCKWSWFPGSPPATAPDCLLKGTHIVSGLCTLFTDAASCNRAANCDWTGPAGLPTSPPTPAPPTGWCLQDGTTVSSLCNTNLESVCNSKSNFRCSWSTTPAAPTPAPANPDCLFKGTIVSSLCTPLTDAASCNRAANCNWAGTV